MKKTLLKWIGKLFSDTHSTVVNIILVSAFAGIGGVLYFAQTLWFVFLEMMQSPSPLWATIVLFILLLIYIRSKNEHQSVPFEPPPDFVIKYFPIGKLIWKVEVYKKNFNVIKDPICKVHDLRMIRYKEHLICPHNGKCDLEINIDVFDTWYSSACSYIDKEIRSSNTKSANK